MRKIKITAKNGLKIIADQGIIFIVIELLLFMLAVPITYLIVIGIAMFFPTFYLHLTYYLKDKDKEIILADNDILVNHDNKIINISSAKKIVIKGSAALKRNIIPYFISPKYYSIIFYFENMDEITLSSLIDVKLKDYVMQRVDESIVEYECYILY